VRQGQDGHFQHFDRLPHVAQWDTTPPGMEWGSLQHQQWLHYYSDNNSAIRRCVWEKIPYPDIPWGEDQVWAWEIIKQGYQKAYANDAIVIHSHNLSEFEQAKISRIEGDFWLRYFNYRFESDPDSVKKSIDFLNTRDIELATSNNIPKIKLHEQKKINNAAISSRYISQYNLVKRWRSKCLQ
jgi:GT2 family glycosyltransferase